MKVKCMLIRRFSPLHDLHLLLYHLSFPSPYLPHLSVSLPLCLASRMHLLLMMKEEEGMQRKKMARVTMKMEKKREMVDFDFLPLKTLKQNEEG